MIWAITLVQQAMIVHFAQVFELCGWHTQQNTELLNVSVCEGPLWPFTCL